MTNISEEKTVYYAAESDSVPAEIRVESETVNNMREPPPPYSVSGALELNPQVLQLQPTNVQQQTVAIQPPLKNYPTIYTCRSCGETVMTRVEHVNTRTTHMCAGFICGCATWCMLCCLGAIPYMLPICKKAKHYCPNCKNFIGDYSKI